MKRPEQQGKRKWPKHGRARARRNAARNRMFTGSLEQIAAASARSAVAFKTMADATAAFADATKALRRG